MTNWVKDGYICTPFLRFVERDVVMRQEGPYEVTTKVKVLQQLWATQEGPKKADWRDVPTDSAGESQ